MITQAMQLEPDKQYKVSGQLIYLLLELSSLYEIPDFIINGGYSEIGNSFKVQNKQQIQILPFPTEKCHYLIGRILQEIHANNIEEAE